MIDTMRSAATEVVVQYVVRHARSLASTPAEFAELMRDIDAIGGAVGREVKRSEARARSEEGSLPQPINVTGQRTSGCGP